MRGMKDKRKTLEIVEEDIVGGFKEIVQSGVGQVSEGSNFTQVPPHLQSSDEQLLFLERLSSLTKKPLCVVSPSIYLWYLSHHRMNTFEIPSLLQMCHVKTGNHSTSVCFSFTH
ncbi:unnamed protein product [Caretta caretta]